MAGQALGGQRDLGEFPFVPSTDTGIRKRLVLETDSTSSGHPFAVVFDQYSLSKIAVPGFANAHGTVRPEQVREVLRIPQMDANYGGFVGAKRAQPK